MTTAALSRNPLGPGGKARRSAGTPRRAAKAETARTPLTWRSVLPGLASAVLSAQLILIMVAVFASYAVNGPTVVVIGGSMEPNVPKGSVLVAKVPEPGSIKEGTIVVYEGDNGTVTHRVVAASGDGEYITRGDANAQDDSTPLTADRIKGQARVIVPWIGWPRVWWQESNHVALGGWIAILLSLVWLSGLAQRKRPSRAGSSEPEDDADTPSSDEADAEVTIKRTYDPAYYQDELDTEITFKRPVEHYTPPALVPAPQPAAVIPIAAPVLAAGYPPAKRRCQLPRQTGEPAVHRVPWTPPPSAHSPSSAPRRVTGGY